MEKETKIILFIVIGSFLFYSSTLQSGILSTDENGYLYLSRSTAERFPGEFLEQDEYFKGTAITENAAWAFPFGAFFTKNGHIYAAVHMGFPMLSAPFYRIFGPDGPKLFNSLVASLTLVVIYFGAKKLFDRNTAHIAVLLYLFATFSMFYAASMWHHTLAAMGFILAQVSYLYLDRGKKAVALFVIGSAVAVWAAYYMIFPLFILFLLALREKKIQVFPLVVLIILLSISWAYNAQVFYSFIGKSQIGVSNVMQIFTGFGRTLDNFVAMVIYRNHVLDPWGRWEYQKSLLESSPFLVLSLFALSHSRMRALLAANMLYLIMVVSQAPLDLGGYSFNMRYLLPVLPFAAIASAAIASRLFDERMTKLMAGTLLASTAVFFYLNGLLIDESVPYSFFHAALAIFPPLKTLSLFFSAALIASFLLHHTRKNEPAKVVISILLVAAILHSNFVNVADVKIGNEQREYQSNFESTLEGLTENGDVLLIPQSWPAGSTIIDGRTMIYYTQVNYNDPERNEQLENILERATKAHMVIWAKDTDAMDIAKKRNATFNKLIPDYDLAII